MSFISNLQAALTITIHNKMGAKMVWPERTSQGKFKLLFLSTKHYFYYYFWNLFL